MNAAMRTRGASASVVDVAPRGSPPIERMFVHLAIYARDGEKRDRVLGFARASLSIDDMLESTLRAPRDEGIAVELVDPDDSRVLGSMTPVAGIQSNQALEPEKLEWRGQLQIADRTLDLLFDSTPGYIGHSRLMPIYALLAAGLIVSGRSARLRPPAHAPSTAGLEALTQELLDEVTERRHSEQRLSRSEARYRVLVENSPDAILLNQQGRISFVNNAVFTS